MLWDHLTRGHSVVIEGPLPSVPSGFEHTILRVHCTNNNGPLGPWQDLSNQVARLGGQAGPGWRIRDSLRQRLLGADEEEGVLTAINRMLVGLRPSPIAVFDHLEQAPEATLRLIEHVLRRPSALHMPLFVDSRGAPAGRLSGLGSPMPESSDELPAVGPVVRRVLRAAGALGSPLQVATLAHVLELSEGSVLDALQEAADAGVGVADEGNGWIRISGAEAWVRGLLPSLRDHWMERARAALTHTAPRAPLTAPHVEPPAKPSVEASVEPPAEPSVEAPVEPPVDTSVGPPVETPAAPPAEPPPAPAAPPAEPPDEQGDDVHADDQGDGYTEAAENLSADPDYYRDTGLSTWELAANAPEAPDPNHSAELIARAEGLITQLLGQARQLARSAAPERALANARQAMALLEQLPATHARRRQLVEILLWCTRLQAEGQGPPEDFSLPAALAAVETAAQLLHADDPLELRVGVRMGIADVCYELGDPQSLERTLSELTDAVRELEAAGDPLGAARLLNDQAAVWVRLGDPVRAAHLLRESRKIFAGRAQLDSHGDPGSANIARAELAETDHLLARLALHVKPRPGLEQDALLAALEHGRQAASAYAALGRTREAARAWETMARVEQRLGQVDQAADHLTRAGRVQQEIGDLIGLARTSSTLSALLADVGRHPQAIQLLAQSISLNAEKGSPLGLAYNRRSLIDLQKRIGPGPLARQLMALEASLAAAEETLGRLDLPGESD